MALIITDSLPTAYGVNMSNLYMVVDAQYSKTSDNILEISCSFFASKDAQESGAKPIPLGNTPLASLTNALKFNLMEVVGGFNFETPVTVQTGQQVFGVLSAAYYTLVKQVIVKIESELNITINYTEV